MTERGILFSAPMVRALLDGRKTQTRRVVKAQAAEWSHFAPEEDIKGREFFMVCGEPERGNRSLRPIIDAITCPYGQPGDHLWVRETFALSVVDPDGGPPDDDPENYDVIYRATDTPGGGWTDGEGNSIAAPWKSSIHMPRWASRILLEVVSVRVERLQDITPDDAVEEGIERVRHPADRVCYWRDYVTGGKIAVQVGSYRSLWEHINGAGTWDANPWVWVVEFKRIEA